jgi:hypothetical protein
MTTKPISTLKADVATAINDNTTGDVTPADVRTSIIDTIDSIQAFNTIAVSGQSSIVADATLDTLNIASGTNITLTTDATTDTLTIATTAEVNQNVFTTIAVSGQSDVVADSKTDTLNLVAGSNVTITTNASTDTITISATGGGGGGGGGDLLAANNLSELTNFATARSNLGLAIGTNVQAFSSVLQNTTASFTTADETKLDGIATGAEVNQNTFSTISVSGQSDIVAEAKTDTLTIAAGSNIALTTNATTDTLTIATTGLVQSNITGITGADVITNMVSLTQAEYDALTPKNASTFYVIVG